MVTGNEVADFPECPSWLFEDGVEAMRFQELNPIILKAADPISDQRHQSGWGLLGELEALLPGAEPEPLVASEAAASDWGRYIYAALAVGLVLSVTNYVRLIDQALDEATEPTEQRVERR
jgi:hypothetical protein